MFNIRLKQLQRRVKNYLSQVKDLDAQTFAAEILPQVFGENWQTMDSTQSPLKEIMTALDQIHIVGQIFARAISSLAAEDPKPDLFYKIECLKCVGGLLVCALSEDERDLNTCDFGDAKLSENRYKKMQEELRPIKKNHNQNLTTIESIVLYIVDNAKTHYREVQQFESWKDVLNFVFDVDVDDKTKGAKKIKQTHIKELLLSEGAYGPLIKDIFQKYDGLLVYTMSMLTMLSDTPYSEKFTPYLNKILEKLGSSTKMILLQSRLTKDFELFHQIQNEITTYKVKIAQQCEAMQLDIEPNAVENFFSELTQMPEIAADTQVKESLADNQGFDTIAINSRMKMSFNALELPYSRLNDTFIDIRNSLVNLNEFFDKMIRGVNDITADLFSGGFRAALPLHDIETCELAGIHVKDLTVTSSTQKTKISDEDFDLKQKLLREFEDLWADLKDILELKSSEEYAIQADPQVFTPLLTIISDTYTEWTKNSLLSAYKEEAIFVSRYLFSFLRILHEIEEKIKPFEKIFLNNEIMRTLHEDLSFFSQKMEEINIIRNVSLDINELTKNLWQLNRDYVIQVGKEEQYLNNPAQINTLINDIPQTLKTEFMQRLITREHRQTKMDFFELVQKNIEKLEEIPAEQRAAIVPFDQLHEEHK